VSDFLRSNALKSLLGEGYTGTIFECEEIEYARNFLGSKGGKALLGEGYTPDGFLLQSPQNLAEQRLYARDL
jgi:hypothetical protein